MPPSSSLYDSVLSEARSETPQTKQDTAHRTGFVREQRMCCNVQTDSDYICQNCDVLILILFQKRVQLCRIVIMKPIMMHGHERSITQIKYNKEGDLLFSSAKDHHPNVWYSLNGERLGTYDGQ